MNKRERVIAAINHRTTDILPHQIYLTREAEERVAQYLNDDNFVDTLGNHVEKYHYCGFPTEVSEKPGYFKDDFGVLWNRNGIDKEVGVVEGQVIPEPSLKNFSLPELDEKRIRAEYEAIINRGQDTFKAGNIGICLFERAWSLVGMENLLMYMVTEPGFVHGLIDRITEYNLQIIDIVFEYDFDAFFFGDDWGYQNGLIMGPNYWRTFIKPGVARMYERVKSYGKYIQQHSCGNIYDIIPDLIKIGADIYQTVQPEVYDLKKIKREFGDNIAFNGGISVQSLLPFGSPDEVKRVARETMDIMGQNGGYIAAPTHVITHDVPPENVVALVEVFNTQG